MLALLHTLLHIFVWPLDDMGEVEVGEEEESLRGYITQTLPPSLHLRAGMAESSTCVIGNEMLLQRVLAVEHFVARFALLRPDLVGDADVLAVLAVDLVSTQVGQRFEVDATFFAHELQHFLGRNDGRGRLNELIHSLGVLRLLVLVHGLHIAKQPLASVDALEPLRLHLVTVGAVLAVS